MASYTYALSLGAKNSVVAYFKDLVDKASLNETEKAANNILNRLESSKLVSFLRTTSTNIYSSVTKSVPQRRKIAEFTQELYDKAISLPEAQSITFEYVTTVANYKYGLFKGGNIYRDYNGTLESTDNSEKLGWIYIDNTNSEYCLFTKDNKSFIIALVDFEPRPVVADFYPLYEKLQESQYSKADSIVNDTFTAFSLLASYRAVLSGAMSNLYAVKSLLMDEYYNPISSFIESFDGKMIGAELPTIDMPNWLRRNQNNVSISETSSLLNETKELINANDSVTADTNTADSNKTNHKNAKWKAPLIRAKCALPTYEIKDVSSTSLLSSNDGRFADKGLDLTLVQAIVYDAPNKKDTIRNILCCYQQPDTVSYTASSQFDSPQPRGSQIPFNFYQCANAMTLNFTLKWHIDEVRSMFNSNEKTGKGNLSLQDIADLAEKFTRPVMISGNSILPRTVFVILPGITRRGYMTEAQISLSGDLTGKQITYSTANRSGSGTADNTNTVANIEYQYTNIEVAFSLLITDDVTLYSQNENDENSHDGKADKEKTGKYLMTRRNDEESSNNVATKTVTSSNESSSTVSSTSSEVVYSIKAIRSNNSVPVKLITAV